MKRLLNFQQLLRVLLTLLVLSVLQSQETLGRPPCNKYSDSFDFYDVDRWHEVLLYSKEHGRVTVENGQLVLKAPGRKPIEVQLYSLFMFEGDFDIKVDYDLSKQIKIRGCRFNTGIVLQSSGDEINYKFYIATRPPKNLFFRFRLDRFGEQNIEKHKGREAPLKGQIRVIRKAGQISFWAMNEKGSWEKMLTFKQLCEDKLRLRFKLQTSNTTAKDGDACRARVQFDNFVVNSCDQIIAQ